MPGFARLALAVTGACALISSSALAIVDVEGNSATLAWTPSSGPVIMYTVHLARNNDAFTDTIADVVFEPQVTIHGEFGERVRVRVVAWGFRGMTNSHFSSDPSLQSEPVRFVDPASSSPDPAADPSFEFTSGPAEPSADPDPPADPDPIPPPPLPAAGAAPYDFDGDGRTDLLWFNSRTRAMAVWPMNRQLPSIVGSPAGLASGWRVVGSGDFDRDGRADILLHDGSGAKYEIWFMNGASVREAVLLDGPIGSSGVDAMGDFDGDGYVDLLWRGSRETLVWFMRGATVYMEVVGPPAPGLPVCAPDLDGDGRSDMLWTGVSETIAWLMVGSSSLRSQPVGPPLPGSSWFGCGDANGDGFGDVLWSHPQYGTNLWAMSGGVGVDRSFELPQLQEGWAMEASGDFDGDGLANDIVIRHLETGVIDIWELRWNGDLSSFGVPSTGTRYMGDGDWKVVAP
jgi:hypothetical protein